MVEKITMTLIETIINNEIKLNLTENKEKIFTSINENLLSKGFSQNQIDNKTTSICKIIDKKQFYNAISIIQKVLKKTGTNINCDNYDGLIVKKLPDSDIITKNKRNRNSGQSDIRPQSNQENIFPFLSPPEQYIKNSKIYNSLKNYFLYKLQVNLYESNLDYLKTKQKSTKEDTILKSHTTVLKDNMNRLEISSQLSLDGKYFSELRELLYADDYLILLKKKEKFDYDCFGIKINVNETGDLLYDDNELLVNENEGLSDLKGKFFYLDTKTLISADMLNIDKIGENVILYGVPGSGKSWTIKKDYCDDESRMERVIFYQDYTYGDFVGQILPKVQDGNVSYEFTPGPFTRILKKAYENTNEDYYLIIEEINRGNAPAIFGDIFQLLDRKTEENDNDLPIGTSEYFITNSDIADKIYNDKQKEKFGDKVRIPSNLSIIATMNTSDQNVFTLDNAFQRRWTMKMIDNNFDDPNEKDFYSTPVLGTDVSWEKFCTTINDAILEKNQSLMSSEDKRLGVYFVNKNELENADLFAQKVIKYLWDDAFKFSRDKVFDKSYTSLEYVIRDLQDDEKEKFSIFSKTIQEKFNEKEPKNSERQTENIDPYEIIEGNSDLKQAEYDDSE